jgi:hypothetical protein
MAEPGAAPSIGGRDPAPAEGNDVHEPERSGRLFAGLAVVILVAGCSSNASATPTPASTPGRTAVAEASPSHAPTPTKQAGLTGPIGDGRQIHTATVLADGSVLIVGGFAFGDGPLASATRYVPVTRVFSQTGQLATARGSHSATLLPDGKVLVAGGGTASWTGGYTTFLASAELYDPATGTFTATGAMATARESHTATRLNDGRVLIAGGQDRLDHAVASAEIYDPSTGTFSATGSMTVARAFHTATPLSDGRVLIVGGNAGTWSFDGPFYASAEIYDPKTGKFNPTGSMATPRGWHIATLLGDGRVLVAGGEYAGADLASAEIYNPKTGKFSSTGSMTVARLYAAAASLSDGRVLITGGGSDYASGQFLKSAELYDPATGRFGATGSMTDGRTNHVATGLLDGRVLVTGGYGAVAPLASAEIYDPITGAFYPAG